MQQEHAVGNIDHLHAIQAADRADNFLLMPGISGAHSDVPRHGFSVRGDDIHRAQVASLLADGAYDTGKPADSIRIGQADGEAVTDRWNRLNGFHEFSGLSRFSEKARSRKG